MSFDSRPAIDLSWPLSDVFQLFGEVKKKEVNQMPRLIFKARIFVKIIFIVPELSIEIHVPARELK